MSNPTAAEKHSTTRLSSNNSNNTQTMMAVASKVFLVLLAAISVSALAIANNDTKRDLDAATSFTEDESRRILSHGPWPGSTPTDKGNELSEQAWAEQLGLRLFSDTDLSGDGTFSCASCHQIANGFADRLPLAQGVQQHVRNTQGLLDVGVQRWFGWDGGADSLWAATLRPMLSEIEMAGNINEIAERLRNKSYVANAFKQLEQHSNSIAITDEEYVVFAAKSIAAYMRTLRSGVTPFDQYRNALAENNPAQQSQYSTAAKRGLKLFIGEANCHVCHFGPNFSNGEFHDTGRPFFTGVGAVDPGRYTGIQRVRQDRYNLTGQFSSARNTQYTRKTTSVKLVQSNFGQWRTPSLRNLTLTAPYMHDGSLSTLRDVVDAYADIDPARLHSKGESILQPLNLSDQQRNDLVSFLQSLTAE